MSRASDFKAETENAEEGVRFCVVNSPSLSGGFCGPGTDWKAAAMRADVESEGKIFRSHCASCRGRRQWKRLTRRVLRRE